MKILLTVPSLALEDGGPAFFVRDAAEELSRRGHDVTVVAHAGGTALALPPGVRRIDTSAPRGLFGFIRGLPAEMDREVRSCDVVVINGVWQHTALVAARSAARAGVPYVVFPHGMIDPYIVNRTWAHALGRRVQLAVYQRKHLARSAAVIFTNPSELTKATPMISSGELSTAVVRYGTPDPRLPEAERAPAARMRVGFLGRLHPKKNLVALVEAVGMAADLPLTLSIVGPPSPHLDHVRERIESLGLQERVSLDPPVPGPQRFSRLQSWDWLVLPSFQENFGQVVSEALSVGTPAILSRALDIAEGVAADGAAILTGTDADTIADALRTAAGIWSNGSVAEFRRRARRCYEERFDFAHTISDLEEILVKVTAEKR